MTHLKLPALERFPQHRHLLNRALAYFNSDQRIVGLIVGGSIAAGGVDFFSDVDLYIVAQDEYFDAVFAERAAAAEAVGEPFFRFIADHHPGGDQDYIVVYAGPVKVDFMYYRLSDMVPGWKWANSLILMDRDGILAKIKSDSQGKASPQPAHETILVLNQKFWAWCWYVFGKILRGELWEALDGIHGIRSMALLPLLARATDQPDQGYRRLESKIDTELAARLEDTVAVLSAEALYAALQAEIDVFCDLRQNVFPRYDLDYDPAPEQIMRNEISQRWAAKTDG